MKRSILAKLLESQLKSVVVGCVILDLKGYEGHLVKDVSVQWYRYWDDPEVDRFQKESFTVSYELRNPKTGELKWVEIDLED